MEPISPETAYVSRNHAPAAPRVASRRLPPHLGLMADSAARPPYDRPSLISPAGPNPPPTMEELRDVLVRDPARLAAASRVRGWLVQEARTKRDTGFLVAGLCERLNEAGVPIDRGSLALETLHSEHAAIGRFWVKGEGSHSE